MNENAPRLDPDRAMPLVMPGGASETAVLLGIA